MISLSRIIKSGGLNTSNHDKKVISVISFESFHTNEIEKEIEDIPVETVHSAQLVEEAKLLADQLINEAKQQVEQFYREMENNRLAFEEEKQFALESAKAQGFQLGLSQGRDTGYDQYKEEIQQAKDVILSAKTDYNKIIESSDREILTITLKVAKKIIGYELDQSNDAYLSIVKKVLKETRDYDEVQLHVHPSMYDFILSAKEELISLFPKEISFYIFPNEDLVETDVFIEYAGGRIDASIDSQLAEIKYKLLELLDGEG